MRLISAGALTTALLLCSCANRTTCYVWGGELTRSQSLGDWHLIRVNTDGSVVLTEAGHEITLPPPGGRTPGKPRVVESSHEAQTCTLRDRRCDQSFVWYWSD